MADQELEYHWTLPASNGSVANARGGGDGDNDGDDDDDDDDDDDEPRIVSEEFVFVYEEDKRPVVVLLGWAGCQDKYLAKYSAIYEERSCITLRCTAPVEYLFWRRDRLPRISKKLIQVITEKCSAEHPVFFHVFSNGGAIFYQHISYAMQQAGSPLKVKGVVFDSSPGERRIMSLYRAISAIIGGHPLTNMPISFMITFFLSFIWLFEILAQSFGKGNATNTDPTALTKETYSWPQIFLYSNADTLIRASDVEKFAMKRAERGVRTQLVLFTDSPHVKHYATYRDVYVSTVCNFINECLTESIDQEANENNDADENDSLLNLTKRIVIPQDVAKQ
ncbi:transmembrane protein 53 isoform X2 [Phymastichus coffea]|uniref:transmembrane protein 53 isoform X2 n=1 Tax=Phymastichus coffea TaxID=108790 RepID=UPI00273B0C91|nr:transmembrane protein 53 isoform X2 [Phymastichus coffea]